MVPAELTGVVDIDGGLHHSVAVHADGTVTAWGGNDDGQTDVPAGLTDVTAISSAAFHNLALRGDGTVAAWGRNDDGQSTTIPAGLNKVTAIAAGDSNLALRTDGTVTTWSDNRGVSGWTDAPVGLSGVAAIAAGDTHSLALHHDGTVSAWGWNDVGQLDVPNGLDKVVALAAGNSHSLALHEDGTVSAWGWNDAGQLDVPNELDKVVAIAAGYHHSLALQSDGTVTAWGDDRDGKTTVPPGLSGVTAIGTGDYHNLAVGARPVFVADSPPTMSTVGASYSYAFTATTIAPTFTVTSGSIPAGLVLTPEGVLAGTPTVPGSFTFTISATNPFGSTETALRTVTVAPTPVAPAISGDVSAGIVGSAYDFTYAISGTPAPAVSVLSGALPPGLTLHTAGRLSGTPSAAGTFTFTVQAVNTAGTAEITSTIAVSPAPVAPTLSGVVGAGVVGSAYDFTYVVIGTPAPTVSVQSGTLPPGLALDFAGRLTGTPTTAGTYMFTVQAANTAGTTQATSTLTVSPQKVATRADLRVDLSAPSSVVKGKTYAYALITKNAGPSTSTSVYSKVILPANVQFVSATGKYTRIGNLVIFQRSSLTNGQSVAEKITVRATTTGRSTALATTFSTRTPDPAITSNTDTTITTTR